MPAAGHLKSCAAEAPRGRRHPQAGHSFLRERDPGKVYPFIEAEKAQNRTPVCCLEGSWTSRRASTAWLAQAPTNGVYRHQVLPVVRIRTRELSDLDSCVLALRRVHDTMGYPMVWPADPKAFLNHGTQVGAFVAELDGVICGHVAVARPKPGDAASAWAAELGVGVDELLCVSLFYVDPQAQGGGAGSRLLEAAHTEILERGAAPALEVVSLNTRAIALYEARGWRRIGSVGYSWLPEPERSFLYVGPAAL
jgi:GNAT superfamily N-acetyltransferase